MALTITWTYSDGLKIYLDGKDYQLTATRPVEFPRQYQHISRLVVGRYATDDSVEWEMRDSYGFGRLDFAGLFYLPFAIEEKDFADYLGWLGRLNPAIINTYC